MLTAETHYEKMMEMFGKKGYFCTTVEQIQDALRAALKVKYYTNDQSSCLLMTVLLHLVGIEK